MISPGLLRLLLAFLVVLHHSTPLRLGGWAVLVFFVISGYWISRMWDQKYSLTKLPPITFIFSRWFRIAPVMLICIVLYFAFYGGLQDYSQIWISRQLPIFASTWSGTPLPPQWSLDVEMQFYVLFAFIAVISRLFYHNSRLSLSPWLPLAFVSICYSVWHLASGGSIEEPKLFVWLGFFCLGIAIYKTGWLPSKNLAIGLAISFILGTIIIILRIQTRSAFWISGREAALQELSGYAHFLHWPNLWLAVGVLFFLPFISLNVNQLSSPFDRELGNLAYPLYMFHWIPRTWYYNHANWERPILYNLTLLLINILTAFAGSWLIYILLDRPIDRFRSRWVSRRMSTKSKIS